MARAGAAQVRLRCLLGVALAYAFALAAILAPMAALDAMASPAGHGLCLGAEPNESGPPHAGSDQTLCACVGVCQPAPAALVPPGAALHAPPPLLIAFGSHAARDCSLAEAPNAFSARAPPKVVS